MRQSIVRSSRQAFRPARLFSTSVRTMAEGDLGAPRAGGGGYVVKPCHDPVSCVLLIRPATPSTSARRQQRTNTSSSKRCQSKIITGAGAVVGLHVEMLTRGTQAPSPSTEAKGSEESDRGAREGLVCSGYRLVMTLHSSNIAQERNG